MAQRNKILCLYLWHNSSLFAATQICLFNLHWYWEALIALVFVRGICFCGCCFTSASLIAPVVSLLLLFTSLYTKICHCVERPCWQVTMPLAEGGPHRTSNPLGTEPRIALPWGSLDPITRSTNTQRQLRNNSLATCQKSDINSDLIADKQNVLCFVIDMVLHWLKQRNWHVYKPTWSSSIKSEKEKVVLTSWKDFLDSAELILIAT